jgi:hypothetical protein
VFQKDGTFVKEFRVDPQTLQNGSVWDLVLSEDAAQRFIFVADGANMQINTLDRQRGETLAHFWSAGTHGRRMQVGAQRGHRFEGQPLHERGWHRPARAKIPAQRRADQLRPGATTAACAAAAAPEGFAGVLG